MPRKGKWRWQRNRRAQEGGASEEMNTRVGCKSVCVISDIGGQYLFNFTRRYETCVFEAQLHFFFLKLIPKIYLFFMKLALLEFGAVPNTPLPNQQERSVIRQQQSFTPIFESPKPHDPQDHFCRYFPSPGISKTTNQRRSIRPPPITALHVSQGSSPAAHPLDEADKTRIRQSPSRPSNRSHSSQFRPICHAGDSTGSSFLFVPRDEPSPRHTPPPPPNAQAAHQGGGGAAAAAVMASSVAAAASTFLGTRLADPAPQNGRIVARFAFGGKKPAPPKKAAKSSSVSDRPLWYPGAVAPDYLDGSLVGDYGFDPWGLGKPAEYLQFELDSLDQNLAKNEPGAIIGTRFESSDVKSTPFQPYSEVFGLQRFRECELIHGRWAMLATLGALSVEWLTGVTWQDAGKVRRRPFPSLISARTRYDDTIDGIEFTNVDLCRLSLWTGRPTWVSRCPSPSRRSSGSRCS